MEMISATAISTLPATDSGAVPPAEGSEQACTGRPARPDWISASMSITLNSSGVNEHMMVDAMGRSRRRSLPPAAVSTMRIR